MLHGNVLLGSLECLLKTQLKVHFKKCPLSTQTFSHTFWQNGHALVYAFSPESEKVFSFIGIDGVCFFLPS